MAKAASETPLMQQHNAIKQKYPDAILLFRVGDFYETFGQDALKASSVLGITLTKRNNGAAGSLELAGFPHHALDTYLHKLVKAGYRVAICDQLEDPKTAKGIVKRGVTEMVTPGIATNDKLLDHHSNNFLASLHLNNFEQIGAAFLDISTGEFFVAEGNVEYIDKLIQSLKPAEIIFQRSYQKQFRDQFGTKWYTYHLESWIYDFAFANELLLKHFQTHSLKGFGIDNWPLAITAAGAILHYLKETEHPHLQHITQIQRIERDDFLWMDRFTIRNLELVSHHNEDWHTLLKALDNTCSAMGARLLKRWMLMPLKDLHKINERLNAVSELINQTELRQKLVHAIKQCGDIERLASKIPAKKINPREVLQIAKALQHIADVKWLCEHVEQPYLKRIGDALNPCKQIATKIVAEIQENPPAVIAKGNVIQQGVHAELDELRQIAGGGKEYLVQLQQNEAEKTGISSLKIGFNNVFGYYLEVTHSHKHRVPENWIRKQTLTNAERYITPELKVYEEKITGAEEKILALEAAIYDELIAALYDYIAPLQVNGNMLATIDCLCCFAENAIKYHYVKPNLHEDYHLDIEQARHPVIEQHLPPGEAYIANDIVLNNQQQQIIILTGPNMSGKSALLRQTALITLMAHMGSFVSATKATIPLTDKIFTRVGASDNLSAGESTFMVEMNETASIINNISARSLILLDEIGRGTSTYDGISIAWAMVEYLQQSAHKPKTLFATHYHELNELENQLSGIKNYHISSKEVNQKIIFLRKLTPGGSTHSFGIQVAKMAGMPPLVIQRANQILHLLEQSRASSAQASTDGIANQHTSQTLQQLQTKQNEWQLSIFDVHTETFQQIRDVLQNIDINRLTPVEALMKLNEIKQMIL